MNDPVPHLVIAEREFLIALDAEYMIKSALECRISIVRPEQLDAWDAAALSGIDLCLLDVPLDVSRVEALARRLREHDVPLLFTSVCEIHRNGVEGLAAVPVAMKPYETEAFIDLVKAGLERRKQPIA